MLLRKLEVFDEWDGTYTHKWVNLDAIVILYRGWPCNGESGVAYTKLWMVGGGPDIYVKGTPDEVAARLEMLRGR